MTDDSAITRVIRGRRLVLPDRERAGAIFIADETIESIRALDAPAPSGAEEVDAGEFVVLPGLVDTHVHINEPGRTEWEGFETATRAAAAGGITTLVDMPLNSSPVTTTVAGFEAKLAAARGKLHVDCGFWGGVVPGNARELEPLAKAGVLGFKCFMTHSGIDDFPDVSESDLREAMPIIARLGLPLLAHAEINIPPVPPGVNPRSYRDYEASRPPSCETAAIEMLVRLCRETGCRTHVVHVSAAESLSIIAAAQHEGLPFTAETCPHYLCIAADDIPDSATEFKCAPPIRSSKNCKQLWQGLLDGTLSMIVSDHSPCPPGMKGREEGDFFRAWGGIASLQFGLPIIWSEAAARGFTHVDLARWMAQEPARLAGLPRKGTLAQGADADIVFFDPNGATEVIADSICHRHKVTPYLGRRLRGSVSEVFLRGRGVMGSGAVAAEPGGTTILTAR